MHPKTTKSLKQKISKPKGQKKFKIILATPPKKTPTHFENKKKPKTKNYTLTIVNG